MGFYQPVLPIRFLPRRFRGNSMSICTYRHSRQATLLTIGALLSGCASMAPPYAISALPVASAYATSNLPDGASAASIAWRDYFTDPQLQTLIELALANNRDLRTAVLRVDEARAAYGIQRAELFPTLSAQASTDRSLTPGDLNVTGKPLLASQYQVGLGLSA